MQGDDTTILEDLGYKLVLLVPLLDLKGAVGTPISLWDHRVLRKLPFPVGRVVLVSLEVVTGLVRQLDIVSRIASTTAPGDDVVPGSLLQCHVLSAESTDALEVIVDDRERLRVV